MEKKETANKECGTSNGRGFRFIELDDMIDVDAEEQLITNNRNASMMEGVILKERMGVDHNDTPAKEPEEEAVMAEDESKEPEDST